MVVKFSVNDIFEYAFLLSFEIEKVWIVEGIDVTTWYFATWVLIVNPEES